MADSADVVVAGHICLDVIPRMNSLDNGIGAFLLPGKLVDIGPATLTTGGAVSNTGIALHRLGVRTSLMGKVGNDLFGDAILQIIGGYGKEISEGMIIAEGESSSYTIVISPPGIDRIFMHFTGVNDTFAADDLRMEVVSQAKIFHFGYPPLMQRMYEDMGVELSKLLSRVKAEALTVSLDLARPDSESAAGMADWSVILQRALPHVDLFFPSFEEILYMLRKEQYDLAERKYGPGSLFAQADGALLKSLADELIGMGAAVVVLKLGKHGLYLRSTSDIDRLKRMGKGSPTSVDAWRDRELLSTCYQVEEVGTTGAGDCTIAGFLTGLLKGCGPEQVLDRAVAVGACSVERSDAVSGVPSWTEVVRRTASGWPKRDNKLALSGWSFAGNGVWTGPSDRNGL